MFVFMSKEVALSVAGFLNARFAERVQQEGHSFNVVRFAAEVGLERGTLLNLMDEKKIVQGVDSDVISALYKKYGDAFMVALAADGTKAKKRKEEKKKKG